MVKHTRILESNGLNPSFLHCDKYMQFDEDGNICEINLKEFDPNKL